MKTIRTRLKEHPMTTEVAEVRSLGAALNILREV